MLKPVNLYRKRVNHWFYECLTVIVVMALLAWFYHNWSIHINQLSRPVSLRFLFEPAGFFLSEHWFSYDPSDPCWYAIFLAAINTFVLGFTVAMVASCLGLLLGALAAKPNTKTAKAIAVYVDFFRNTPLVVQLLFWYFGIFYQLPQDSEPLLFGWLVISIKQLEIFIGDYFIFMTYLYGFLSVYFIIVERSVGLSISTVMMFLIYLNFDHTNQIIISTEWLALFICLTCYTTAYLTEIVRGAIMSLPKWIAETADTLGLSKWQTFYRIIFPITSKMIKPMFVNQFISVMKNTSAGLLIGYPELMNVLAGTVLNLSGEPIVCISIMMLLYLMFSYVFELLLIHDSKL